MIRNYDGHHSDVVLITLNEMEIGVRTLSSFLKGKGYSVIVGFFNDWKENESDELNVLLQWIENINPALIGISSVEFSRAKATKLISALKKMGRIVVAGGVDVTLNPDYYLMYADFIVQEEGEYALLEFVESVVSKNEDFKHIKNLSYRNIHGGIVTNEIRESIVNLDEIPHEDLLDLQHHYEFREGSIHHRKGFVFDLKYTKYKGKGLFLCNTRGCLFNCSFCSNHKMSMNRTRVSRRSVQSIVDRVAQLKTFDPELSILYFFDDDFFVRTQEEINTFAIAWKHKVNLPFYVYASPVTLTESKLSVLIDAGLVVVNMGVQSGSQRTNLDVYERNMANDFTIAAGTLLHKYAGNGKFGFMMPVYDFIINSPYDNQNDLLQTISVLCQLPKPFSVFMHSLVLFQGTRLYKKAIMDGFITDADTSAKYHFHDTLKHFDNLIRRGGNYYLNSLLYWMNGKHTDNMYGAIPSVMLGVLTGDCTIVFFNRFPCLISCINYIIPTNKRIFNLTLQLEGVFHVLLRMIRRFFGIRYD